MCGIPVTKALVTCKDINVFILEVNNICVIFVIKTFKQKCELKRHRHVYTDDKPYVCDMCEKGFRKKKHLKEHHRIHTGEKPCVRYL